jgi:hypothetical protein
MAADSDRRGVEREAGGGDRGGHVEDGFTVRALLKGAGGGLRA